MCLFAKKITSFEKITLHESGMRHCVDYEIVSVPPYAEVSLYNIGRERERILVKRVTWSMKEAISLLNACGIATWRRDYHPHVHMLDGKMFNLRAIINDGQIIESSGSQAFPKGYHELVDALYAATHDRN